jgi:hypothetical protein
MACLTKQHKTKTALKIMPLRKKNSKTVKRLHNGKSFENCCLEFTPSLLFFSTIENT